MSFLSQKYKGFKIQEEDLKKTYKVVPNRKERPIYDVVFDILENKATCTCHMFEFCGILCKHILTILVKKSLVDHYPKRYILDRWTINAKSQGFCEEFGDNLEEEPQDSFALLRNNLIMELLELVELGYGLREKYNHLKRIIKNIRTEFLTWMIILRMKLRVVCQELLLQRTIL
ncbi:hypothetical protein ACH5RR_019115 [Cinchona calisaya]|uniref:Protein FAR1-RELATED SEQUENCE n=1 Tax=Cinchona calisaya TaxID=153742 RepID=A0ABD2ZNI1_9GENT